jgi:pimeloyl-ACP methyl ester carboxylesterase
MEGVAHSTDGVPIRYETHGAGEPAVVLVHGWSCDRSYWRGQVDHLAAHRQVIAVDLAGHGESGVGRDAWTMAAFGGDVVAVIEQLGLERVVLVGHSMGGDVIVEPALGLPDRVVGLVWVDVYRTLEEPSSLEEREEFIALFREEFSSSTLDFARGMFPAGADSGLVEWVAADMAAAPPEVAVPALDGRSETTKRYWSACHGSRRGSLRSMQPRPRPTSRGFGGTASRPCSCLTSGSS